MQIRKTASVIGAMLLAAGAVLLGAGPAQAAAPTNDTFGAAVVIGSTPFSTTLDTSEATTDADDIDADTFCGLFPATDASVWYSITATSGRYAIDLAESSYPVGVIVVTGSPGAFDAVACGGGGRFEFLTTPGTTYHLLAFDSQSDGGGNGGTLVMNLDVARAPTIDVTVDPNARFDSATGAATLRGTINCSSSLFHPLMEVELRQQVGRFSVVGHGSASPACNGTDQPWSVDIPAEIGGKFTGGKAAAEISVLGCSPFDCASDHVASTVRLTARG